MKLVVKAALLGAAALISFGLHTDVAHAYPGDDDPGYSIDGGGQPGVEHYPAICGFSPIGCGLHYNPGPGTWVRPDPEPYH